jgi:hypothetical protein
MEGWDGESTQHILQSEVKESLPLRRILCLCSSSGVCSKDRRLHSYFSSFAFFHFTHHPEVRFKEFIAQPCQLATTMEGERETCAGLN